MRPRGLFVLVLAGLVAGAAAWILFGAGTGPDALRTSEPAPPVLPRLERDAPEPVVARTTREVAATVAAALPEPAAPPASYLAALGGLTGRILEVDGAPVADLPVTLLGTTLDGVFAFVGAAVHSAEPGGDLPLAHGSDTTDVDGRFRFGHVHPGGLYLAGIDLGGPRATLRLLETGPISGADQDVGDLILEPSVTLTGRVVDPEGAPVADARVRVTDAPGIVFQFGVQHVRAGGALMMGARHAGDAVIRIPATLGRWLDRLPVPTTRTDDDGTFAIAGAPVGLVTVVVDHVDYVTHVLPPVPTGGAGGTRSVGTVRLDDGEVLAGRVESHEGEPVADAEVLVGPLVAFGDAAVLWPAGRTGADGMFRAGTLAAIEHVVAVRAPGTACWRVERGLVPGESAPAIRLAPTYELVVHAHRPDATPIPHPRVRVNPFLGGSLDPQSLFGAESLPLDVRYADDGSARIAGLGSGRFQVTAVADGYAPGRATVEVADGPAEVRVELLPARRLRVRVLDEEHGQPVPHARVDLLVRGPHDDYLAGLFPRESRRADGTGMAVLEGVPAGAEARVACSHPAHGGVERPVPPDAGEVVVRLPAPATLTGIVVAGGGPIDEPRVVGITAEDDSIVMPRVTTTDREGRFRFTGLAPGTYEVVVLRRFAAAEGPVRLVTATFPHLRPEVELEVVVAAGKGPEVVIDVLGGGADGPSARVHGRVLLNGVPMVDGAVTTRARGAGKAGRRSVRTGAGGDFDLGLVGLGDDGAVTLTVTPREAGAWDGTFHRSDLTVEPGDTREIRIDLWTGRLAGSVVRDADGAGLAYAEVDVRGVRNAGGTTTSVEVHTDEAGRFQVPLLPAGEYEIDAEAEGYTDAHHSAVSIPADGSVTTVAVRLIQAVPVSGRIALPEPRGPNDRAWLTFEGTAARFRARLARDDTFTTEDLGPGDYHVSVVLWTPGAGGVASRRYVGQLSIPPGGVSDVVIPLARAE